MSTVHIPLSRRQELCNAEVTLDGRRAVICGYRNEFATVTTLPDGPRYEWSWATVDHIVTTRADSSAPDAPSIAPIGGSECAYTPT